MSRLADSAKSIVWGGGRDHFALLALLIVAGGPLVVAACKWSEDRPWVLFVDPGKSRASAFRSAHEPASEVADRAFS